MRIKNRVSVDEEEVYTLSGRERWALALSNLKSAFDVSDAKEEDEYIEEELIRVRKENKELEEQIRNLEADDEMNYWQNRRALNSAKKKLAKNERYITKLNAKMEKITNKKKEKKKLHDFFDDFPQRFSEPTDDENEYNFYLNNLKDDLEKLEIGDLSDGEEKNEPKKLTVDDLLDDEDNINIGQNTPNQQNNEFFNKESNLLIDILNQMNALEKSPELFKKVCFAFADYREDNLEHSNSFKNNFPKFKNFIVSILKERSVEINDENKSFDFDDFCKKIIELGKHIYNHNGLNVDKPFETEIKKYGSEVFHEQINGLYGHVVHCYSDMIRSLSFVKGIYNELHKLLNDENFELFCQNEGNYYIDFIKTLEIQELFSGILLKDFKFYGEISKESFINLEPQKITLERLNNYIYFQDLNSVVANKLIEIAKNYHLYSESKKQETIDDENVVNLSDIKAEVSNKSHKEGDAASIDENLVSDASDDSMGALTPESFAEPKVDFSENHPPQDFNVAPVNPPITEQEQAVEYKPYEPDLSDEPDFDQFKPVLSFPSKDDSQNKISPFMDTSTIGDSFESKAERISEQQTLNGTNDILDFINSQDFNYVSPEYNNEQEFTNFKNVVENSSNDELNNYLTSNLDYYLVADSEKVSQILNQASRDLYYELLSNNQLTEQDSFNAHVYRNGQIGKLDRAIENTQYLLEEYQSKKNEMKDSLNQLNSNLKDANRNLETIEDQQIFDGRTIRQIMTEARDRREKAQQQYDEVTRTIDELRIKILKIQAEIDGYKQKRSELEQEDLKLTNEYKQKHEKKKILDNYLEIVQNYNPNNSYKTK